jgi:L-amino acid N-acyltransferase YncA
VLFALSHNSAGLQLYAKRGFREVGVFREQGLLDGRFADVTIMEKILAR